MQHQHLEDVDQDQMVKSILVISLAPSIGAAGVRVGSQLDHLLEPAWDSA